ncbi:MAG: winged helix-turn-helix domain-containing protein [Pseudomonadota bacterium]
MSQSRELPSNQIYEIGKYQVFPDIGQMVGPDDSVTHLERKSLQVLIELAAQPGRLVSRDTLLNNVWDGVVVGDESLTKCISNLRKAFGDSARHPEYVETVHGQGYILRQPVTVIDIDQAPPDSPKRLVWTGVAAALLAMGLWLFIDTQHDDHTVAPIERIAILSESNSVDPLDREIFDLSLRTALEQSTSIGVVPEQNIVDARRRLSMSGKRTFDVDAAIDIAHETDAQAVVLTKLTAQDDTLVYQLTSIDVARAHSRDLGRIDIRSLDEVGPHIDVIARSLRTQFGETEQSIRAHQASLADVTTPDLQALRAYISALENRDKDKKPEAIELALEAISKDPDFAAAHILLGRLYYGSHANRDKAEYHWNTALSLPARITDRDKIYVEAQLSWFDDPIDTRAAWQKMVDLYPAVPRGWYNRGNVEWFLFNDFERAAFYYGQGVNALPTDWVNHYHLAYAQLGLNQVDASINSFRKSRVFANDYYNYGLVDALIVANRYDEAETLLFRDGLRNKDIGRPSSKVLGFYLDRGQTQKALDETNVPAWEEPADGGTLLAIQLSRLAAVFDARPIEESREQAKLGLQIAIDLVRDPTKINDLPHVPQISLLAKYGTRLGLVTESEALVQTTFAHPAIRDSLRHQAYLNLPLAEIRFAKGQPQEAKTIVRALVEEYGYYQARESLAFMLKEEAEFEEALVHYEWLANHRGQAFAEPMFFVGRGINIVTWARAALISAQLSHALGDTSKANSYRELLELASNFSDNDHHLFNMLQSDLERESRVPLAR